MTDAEPDEAADVDLWAEVVGQDELVDGLRSAAKDPTHAYLFVGPPGAGTRAAARAFAADVLSAGLDDDAAARVRRLCAADHHPSMVVVERVGASISADQARQIVRQASMSPSEGSVQVLVLTDFHLVTTAAPIMLKSIEEPPAGTVFVVLADEVTPDLVTIASRCSRFDFPPLAASAIASRLRDEGVDDEVADAAAIGAGGDLDRARLLARDEHVVERRRAWSEVPDRLDGTGATAAALVADVLARIDEVLTPLAGRHEAELARITEQAERLGQKVGSTKDVEARHARERRRIRTDELRSGLAALMEGYRRRAAHEPEAFVEAGELVGAFTEGLQFHPNEELALQALFVSLPRPGDRAGR